MSRLFTRSCTGGNRMHIGPTLPYIYLEVKLILAVHIHLNALIVLILKK